MTQNLKEHPAWRLRHALMGSLRRLWRDQVTLLQRPRHDQIAFRRQQYLAAFLLMIDAYVAVISVVVGYIAKWHPLTQDELLLTTILALASMVCFLLAAGAVGGIRDMWNEGIGIAPGLRHRDTDFFAKRRMIFFYTGVNLNMIALALLVGQTGGITASPYIAVFFAFILTGQQLSRFKTQSSFLIGVGIVLTAAVFVCESTVGLPKTSRAPDELTFLLLASTLIACGLITSYEKGQNYLVEGKQNLPTHAHVYRDATGMWHYAVYCRRHRLDPVVGHDSEETGTEGSLESVRKKVEAIVKSMYQAAEWGKPSFEWPAAEQGTDLIVEFPPNEAGKGIGQSR